MARGRTYARAGRIHDLVVANGKVAAPVTGSRSTPYEVVITLGEFDGRTWDRAIAGMAKKAQFSAELLANQMPQEIDEVFRSAGTSLFPRSRTDLATSCSCPDSGNPCKHLAATHYVLGEALDRDPFLLFELRGRPKDQVLNALRAARGLESQATTKARPAGARSKVARESGGQPETLKVKLENIRAADYDKPRETMPVMRFTFDEPLTHGATLRQLGQPAAWGANGTPAHLLMPLVRAAAETARRLALAEPPTESKSNAEATRTPNQVPESAIQSGSASSLVAPSRACNE